MLLDGSNPVFVLLSVQNEYSSKRMQPLNAVDHVTLARGELAGALPKGNPQAIKGKEGLTSFLGMPEGWRAQPSHYPMN